MKINFMQKIIGKKVGWAESGHVSFSSKPLKFLFLHLWYLRHAYLAILLLYFIGRIFYHLQPFFLGKIIDQASYQPINWDYIYWYTAGLIGLGLIMRGVLFRVMEQINELYVEPLVLRNMRFQLFNRIKRHSLSYFENNFSGQLADKVSNIINDSKTLLSQFTHSIFPTLVSYLIVAVLLATVSYEIAGDFVCMAGFDGRL